MPWYVPSNAVLALGSLLWSRGDQLGVWTRSPLVDRVEVLGGQAGNGRTAVLSSAASSGWGRVSLGSGSLGQCVHMNPADASARCMMLIHTSFLSLNQQSYSGGKIRVTDFLLALCSHSSVKANALSKSKCSLMVSCDEMSCGVMKSVQM